MAGFASVDRRTIVEPGDELTDPATGARLRFVETAASTGGASVVMRLSVDDGWSAGPLHVHPAQTERMRVIAGTFAARLGDAERLHGPGDEILVPHGTTHTVHSVDGRGELEVAFEPALRTDRLFESMFSDDHPRRPPAWVPAALRAWIESRGYAAEIRYLWPRRVALLLGVAAAAGVVVGGVARVHRGTIGAIPSARA
jgi:mannose-6-phosphate isomerase-like protein (cupin superfamily)